MLDVQNKDLRSTIAKQRVMIDISESFPRIHELSNLVLKNLESITEKQKISISVSPLKARTNISSISNVSKVTSKNVDKVVSKADNVDFCNQMQPELLSNQPHNILEDFNGIQKTIVIEKDTVVEVSKEIVDKPNQSTIDKIANPKDMEIVKKVASSAMDQSEVSSENWVELWPKSGIEVNSFALSSINRKCLSKMISDLMIILFTDDELRNGSVTGKKSNFIKSGELKKQLDVNKVKAIKDFTHDIFRDVTDEIMNKAIRTKLNNFSKKPKALDFNAGSATRLKNTI
ncbi:uncharacterized protein LOC132934186 [Metopolophium dirhodum]|uniref:uncharacterized protein LOC132934186 n=1 Tax=Metopolophium dirhodum TaxID=44670 RepID=UPI00298F629C|nr:uncharacterized protein LOC132934186 [Metopolophium dirhodum]